MEEKARFEVSKAIADKLVQLLESPNETWYFNEHTAKHATSGAEIWIANGILCTNTYPVPCRFGLRDKYRLWKALGVAQENTILGRLSK